MGFSARDEDRDLSGYECARSLRGGWWHKYCFDSESVLLTLPHGRAEATDAAGIGWQLGLYWRGVAELGIRYDSLKSVKMMVY